MPSGSPYSVAAPSGQYGSLSEHTSRAPAASGGQRRGEERRDLRQPGGLRRRRDEQQPVGLRAALGDVVQPQQAGERMADDDRLAGRQRGQLALEHAPPRVRRRHVGVGQVGVGDALGVGLQPGRQPRLPVARPGALRGRAGSGRCATPSDRYRNPRAGPNAGRDRPDVPDDVGADQARARADGARRGARGALPQGEALENVPRSAADAGHDVRVSGALVRIVRR